MQINTKKDRSFIFDAQITTHAINLAKVNAIDFLNNARLFLDTQKYVFDYYGLDRLCTIYDVYNIEAEALGQKMKYFKNDMPAVDTSRPFIENKSDIKKIRDIDFKKNSRCRFVLDLIGLYQQEIGEGFKPRFCAPFSLAVNIRGFNNLINDIYSDPKFVKELFSRINHSLIAPWIRLQREELADLERVASGADAWIAIPNVNLDILENIVIPAYLELQEMTGNIYLALLGGARYLEHPVKFLEIQKILNPFLVKGLDPDIEALGARFFMEFANDNNMDLLLGVDANFISNSPLEEIDKRIKEYIDIGMMAKKDFILYFNDIPGDIPPEKLKSIFKTVKRIRKTI
ncbi:MAG: uroporphyrinogen decarboxylase family protein [Actinobacteria bacterium]|nr:uroporphyrinogen decarboxylase family protein [Actinomycetota bacterium]